MGKLIELTEEDAQAIVDRFGIDFYEKMRRHLDLCANRWSLTSLRLIRSFSANVVVRCFSPKYGPTVLKIGRPAEIAAEFHTLRRYNGRRFCNVYEADLENGILLEEAVEPGISLRKERSLETTMGRLLVRGGRSGPRGISAIHQSRHVCRNGHECVMLLDPCSIFQPLRF